MGRPGRLFLFAETTHPCRLGALSEDVNRALFCVQPKKTFKNVPFLGKLEVTTHRCWLRTGGLVSTFDGFCSEMTAVAMETLMAAAMAGLAWSPGRE